MVRVKFLDFHIDNISMQEALSQVDRFVDSKRPHQLVAVNAAKIVKMQQDRKLAKLIDSSDLIFADGQAIVGTSRFLGCRLKERVAGIDLMSEIIKRSSIKGYSMYFLGAKEEVVQKLVDIYRKKFPKIEIVGWHGGYFESRAEEKTVINEIKRLKPDILFVAMGTPEKEYWIRNNLKYLDVPVCMGVGGSFDVVAGLVKRAPRWMQKIGMEWFFRFLSEPKRMWKRYLVGNTLFMWLVFKKKWRSVTAALFLLSLAFLPSHLFQTEEKKDQFPFYVPWSYCEGSKIDFSFLLERPAGSHGFVTMKDGHFYFEDGKRARFWGVNIHSGKACFPTHAQAESIAKRLAQLGCNAVRMHLLDNEAPHGIVQSNGNDSQHFSESQMDKLDYFIYKLKENGIYVVFDVLGLGARRFKEGDGVVDYNKIRSGAGGISFFNERIIELSKKFALDFLSHINPYTGSSYLNEPAVAMVEMSNENTLFGNWIVDRFTAYYKDEIDDLWKTWLKEKKGDLKTEHKKWYDDREFKFELQDTYQKEMYGYLRSIGVKCPIGASNMPHDNLDLAADSNMDFTDIHPYWDHIYKREIIHNRPLIKQSHLNPETLVNIASRAKVYNKPLILTEWDSMWPNEWRAVDVLTTAAYAALNDVDALFLYSYNGGWGLSWDNLEKKIYYPTVVFNDPAKMGLFPLGALIFLRQDVKVASNTHYASYSLDSLFDMVDLIPDRHKLAGIMYRSKLEKKLYKSGLDYPYIVEVVKDRDKVISDTGQIIRDSKKGIFTLKTPRTFSFSGFVGNEEEEFSGIRFSIESDFTTVTITSLDGKDISSSKRLLLAVVGRVKNKGEKLTPHITKEPEDLRRDVYILDTGEAPILVEGVKGEIFIKKKRRQKDLKIFSLDEEGCRKEKIPARLTRNFYNFNFSGEQEAIYYEIIRI